ncbi:response regulator transcription factor [Bosea sp. ASV33]|uniref:response regulator n=1 Tax=Bosea sp. ASV33 TaxID=2795106 RepID=UPI0018EC1D4C|nr:response regulator transcription factor [Bosea sp. ASV33]
MDSSGDAQHEIEKPPVAPLADDHGHILVVDDDPQIRLLVARFLQRYGYRVTGAPDGRAMMEALMHSAVDLIVLDLMLPARSGVELCRDVRATSQVPIVMLTARTEESDRITGLEGGADDYVTKPFSPRELLARIRALLRRARAGQGATVSQASRFVTFDGWRMDLRRRELQSPAGTLIDLSTGEFDLLVVFVEHANHILSREALMQFAKARTSDDPFDRTIDVQISRLRRKLEADAGGGQLIKTVRGAGYLFAATIGHEEGPSA